MNCAAPLSAYLRRDWIRTAWRSKDNSVCLVSHQEQSKPPIANTSLKHEILVLVIRENGYVDASIPLHEKRGRQL